MKIHFITTSLGNGSGGAIYDKNFFDILVKIYPNVKLYDDQYFLKQKDEVGQKINFLGFNNIYNQYQDELANCDYLIMNSRLYTRFIKIDIKKLLCKHPNIKYIVIHHHNNYMIHKGALYLIHKWFEMKVLNSATWLIIPNQYVIDQLRTDQHINNIYCLPSSFIKKKYKVSDLNNGNVLFVGNVEKRKGLIYGIKAFNIFYKHNKNYKYIIAGNYEKDDPYFKKLKRFIKKNNLENAVIFEGRVTNERLDWLYSNSDLLLFPSLMEGYGWVMIEAMGHGVPVMAFHNSAMPYTVKHKYNGMLVENMQWKKMGRALSELLTDKTLLKQLQTGALITYQEVPAQEDLNEKIKLFIESWK